MMKTTSVISVIRRFLCALSPIMVFLLGLLVSGGATLYAVGTAFWEINDKTLLAKGEMENLVMSADGYLTLGATSTKIEIKDQSVWTSVAKDETVYFGTGSGKIYKLNQRERKLDEIYDTKELLVTSLVISDNNDLFVGTLPNGKIFKIDRAGKPELFTAITATHIWALTFGPDQKTLYAGTGPEGKIYEIDQKGKYKPFYDTKKKVNILSLVFDGKDYLYFGTTNPGLLYRISLKGKPEIISDFGQTEIKSLLFLNKDLYVAVNSGIQMSPESYLNAIRAASAQPEKTPAQPTPPPQPPAPPLPPPPPSEEQTKPESKETPSEPKEEIQPTAPPPEQSKPPVNSAIYKISGGGMIKEIISLNNCYITDLKLNQKGEIFVGTDNTGKVFHITADGKLSIPFDFETNQVLTLLLDKNGGLRLAGTGNPASVYIIQPDNSQKGSYMSEVFDAKFVSRWGNFTWKGKGKIGFQSHSGNTIKPDETWSEWSEVKIISAEEPFRPTSPAGRYFQFKLIWDADKEARLTQTKLAYLINNQPPKITVLTVAPLPPPPPPPPQPGSSDPAIPRSTIKTITWQAADTDGDPLGFRIYYKREDQKNWVALNPENLFFGAQFNWDTGNLPDGVYHIKLIATDEKANPGGQPLTDEKMSLPVIVDNTAPEIKKQMQADKMIVSGKATDALSPIKIMQYSLDGKPWEVLPAKDQMMDSKSEEFELALKDLKKGWHTIQIRAIDETGNTGFAQEEFEVK